MTVNKRDREESNITLDASDRRVAKKERTHIDDVYSRTLHTKTHGRGSLAGWTSCPLCNASTKKYAMGRGITMHLNEVHKPWQPLKAEIARRERLRRKCTGIVHRIRQGKITDSDRNDPLYKKLPNQKDRTSWEELLNAFLRNVLGDVWDRDSKLKPICYDPTPEEVEQWAKDVIQIAQDLEANHETEEASIGYDRFGNIVKSYDQSLPPFLMAAKDGKIQVLKEIVNKTRELNSDESDAAVQHLVETIDRNGSNAFHWSAGGGHLDCLRYLFSLTVTNPSSTDCKSTHRRRDGKTCMHYAARNGQNHIIDYLVREKSANIDITSGDGTTPLHLACFGGHLKTVRHLIEIHGADRCMVNDWGCGIGHWVAMTIQKDEDEVISLLNYLRELHPCTSFDIFGMVQKQGHSSLHKAAQKLNKTVLKWLVHEAKRNWTEDQRSKAGCKDVGGNTPATIWRKMGGDNEFGHWLEVECSWLTNETSP